MIQTYDLTLTFSDFFSTFNRTFMDFFLYSNLIPHQDLHHCRHLPWLLTVCRRHHRHLRRPTHQVRHSGQKLAEKREIWTQTWIKKLQQSFIPLPNIHTCSPGSGKMRGTARGRSWPGCSSWSPRSGTWGTATRSSSSPSPSGLASSRDSSMPPSPRSVPIRII